MSVVRLGAVGYLNARPLVYGLERCARFDVRYDIPSECARRLHAHEVDLGLIPSIEYLRGPAPYAIVSGPAITSKGPVASVAIYTRRDPADIRTIAMDTSSRASVALATIVLRRFFGLSPQAVPMAPDLDAMLAQADAALIIGDHALFLDHERAGVQKLDLGALWTTATGLPFVYACWTGWPGAINAEDAEVLVRTRDEGMSHAEVIARAFFPNDASRQSVATRYLRHNIRYVLGEEELEGLLTFYKYASELGLVSFEGPLHFYDAAHDRAR